MTRFARQGDGRKQPHQASKWTDLKEPNTGASNSKNSGPKGKLRNIKHNSFKDKQHMGKAPMSQQTKGRSMGKCFNCGQNGHKAAECAEPKQDIQIVCHFCNKNGHKAISCPDKFGGLQQAWIKVKRSEFRRQKRQTTVLSNKLCFNCRETGHQLSECPKSKNDMEHGTGICFKCGSTEHSVHRCRAKVPAGEYPFAKCFICGETGHLSKQCPDNPRGLYPKGGCCNECGSVEHLKRDCPEFQKKHGIEDIKLFKMDDLTSLDANDVPARPLQVEHVTKKKSKIVKF